MRLPFSRSKKLLLLLISFLVGIFLAKNLSPSWQAVEFAVFSLTVFSIVFHRTKLLYLSLALIFFIGGLSYYWFYVGRVSKNMVFGQKDSRAIVVSDPVFQSDKQKFIISTDFGKIFLTTRSFPQFAYGDEIKISGNIEKPQNSSDFNYADYLERLGASGTMNYPQIDKSSSNKANRIYAWLISTNHSFISAISNSMSEPESSLSSAILIGARKTLPQDIVNNFQKTGLTHIIAISGYNVTIVVVSVWWLLRSFGRRWAFFGSIAFILGFVIFTGASSSVIRGGLIAFLALLARFVGRRTNAALLIVLSAAAMIVGNAMVMRDDIGFALSFLAFAGLVYLAPIMQNYLKSKIKSATVANILGETLSAQIFVLPILMTKFGILSIIAPLANILVLPFVPTVMLISFIQGLIGLFSAQLAQIVGWFNWIFLHYIIKVVELMSKIPYSSVSAKFGSPFVIIYYLILIIILWLIYRRKVEKNSTI